MKQLGLYIHIPFCKSKCYYCDFYSVIKKEDFILDKYINAIEREIIFFLENFRISHPELTTIYIGGGTPSLLDERQIDRLFNIIYRYFVINNLKEITMELNPESTTEGKLLEIKNLFSSLSKNIRLSLGVQSFNESILKSIGRLHTKNDVIRAVNIFRKLDFNNYNFDFIFGLPKQNIDDVLKDLSFALELLPTHISCYALTVEEGTYLASSKYRPDCDLQSEMYKKIVDFLLRNKYNIYEISNFAKKGYRCLHNLNYWKRKEYIGIGSTAVSFLNNKRIKNTSSVEEYVNFNFKYEEESITHEIAIKEKLILSLRTTDGLSTKDEVFNIYRDKIKKLLDEKKLVIENEHIKIPLEYMFVSNKILIELL